MNTTTEPNGYDRAGCCICSQAQSITTQRLQQEYILYVVSQVVTAGGVPLHVWAEQVITVKQSTCNLTLQRFFLHVLLEEACALQQLMPLVGLATMELCRIQQCRG